MFFWTQIHIPRYNDMKTKLLGCRNKPVLAWGGVYPQVFWWKVPKKISKWTVCFAKGVHFNTKFIILHEIFRTKIFAKRFYNFLTKNKHISSTFRNWFAHANFRESATFRNLFSRKTKWKFARKYNTIHENNFIKNPTQYPALMPWSARSFVDTCYGGLCALGINGLINRMARLLA